MFFNSVKAIGYILLMFALSACQSIQTQQFEKTRDQQQLELATLLEDLWQRAHIIPKLQQGAPLVSSSAQGQQTIRTQNSNNIQTAKLALQEVDNRLAERKKHPEVGDVARLNAIAISDSEKHQYQAKPLTLFRSEQVVWPLRRDDGVILNVNVVWNEDGNLYVEGQDILNLNPSTPDTPTEVQLYFYGGAVVAQASMRLTLEAELLRF